MPLCPIKWRPLKFFAKLQKSPLLISNIVKDAGQFLATKSPWKIKKNFYFILTNWMCYWQIRFCTCEISLNQMCDIPEVWKYWPLKDSFCSILQKLYRVDGGWIKNFKLLADISFGRSLQSTAFPSLLLFLCTCY